MPMISIRSLRVCAVISLVLAEAGSAWASTGSAGGAKCPSFPSVSWWGNITHGSVRKYVEGNHSGNWGPYLGKWERQLSKLKIIAGRNGGIVAPTGQKIKGPALNSYIEKVKQRIMVSKCLANVKSTASASFPRAPVAAEVIVTESDPKAGKAKAKVAGCFDCHGEMGIAVLPAAPNLAGQKYLYMIAQLKEFQVTSLNHGVSPASIKRHNSMMGSKAEALNDADMWNIADYYSKLLCAPATAPKAPRSAVSERCEKCHGEGGKSTSLGIPNLAGQKKQYLINQLKAFRRSKGKSESSHEKNGRYHFFMSNLATSLNDGQIVGLASYYAGLNCR